MRNFINRIFSFWKRGEDFLFSEKILPLLFFGFLLILSLTVRLSMWNYESGDYRIFLSPWYDHIKNNGGFSSLKDTFSDYAPSYLYLTTLATFLPIPKILAIKLISILFDYILATLVYFLVREKQNEGREKRESENEKTGQSKEENQDESEIQNQIKKQEQGEKQNKFWAMGAFFLTLFAPNVLLNSSFWAQSDVIYTSFLLSCLLAIFREKMICAFVFFGLAFSFKLQAIFFAPLLIVLILKRKVTFLHIGIVPLVYLLFALPVVLLGRSLSSVLDIYSFQAKQYKEPNYGAANLYEWFGPHLSGYEDNLKNFGISLSFAATAALLALIWQFGIRRFVNFTQEIWLKIALSFCLLIPFCLPRMHERYFFVADILALVLAFYQPKKIWLPIILIMNSTFTYQYYLLGKSTFETGHLSVIILALLIYIIWDLAKTLQEQPGFLPVSKGEIKV